MLKRKSVILLIVCAAMLLSAALKGREEYMLNLPVYRRYSCSICHTSSNPTTDDLNEFGFDFQENNHEWNQVLAAMDSDRDNYANGIELGDEDGDGNPEILFERSNPGDPLNNPNSIDKATWGKIKDLFRD